MDNMIPYADDEDGGGHDFQSFKSTRQDMPILKKYPRGSSRVSYQGGEDLDSFKSFAEAAVAGEEDCVPNQPGERISGLNNRRESSALGRGTDIGSFKSCFDDEHQLTPGQAAQNAIADNPENLDPSRAP
jgi:hypothetical protein